MYPGGLAPARRGVDARTSPPAPAGRPRGRSLGVGGLGLRLRGRRRCAGVAAWRAWAFGDRAVPVVAAGGLGCSSPLELRWLLRPHRHVPVVDRGAVPRAARRLRRPVRPVAGAHAGAAATSRGGRAACRSAPGRGADVRIVHLSDPVTRRWSTSWPGALIHAGTGYVVHRTVGGVAVPRRAGCSASGASSAAGGSTAGRSRIRRWKDRLPEAGALFAGGISKRHVPAADQGGLERFVVETRRAELGHWLAAARRAAVRAVEPAGGRRRSWSPTAWLVNLPFIAVQRYNRIRAARVRVVERRWRRGRAGRGQRVAARRRRGPGRRRRSRDTTGSSIP